ncbi:MAG: hypothetical protein NZ480_06880 [Bdellovibrionaceae bacterium]|nr:hypothetical protein [Pseudobdellovibrionaceae bacterium]MDW8190306.1 hypothetical protein [Pseudobdellovibrionaceae bacterium]
MVLFLFPWKLEAAKKIKPVMGTIITPETAVYEEPSFDSIVIESVQEKTKVFVWPKLLNHAFFRIKLPNGVIGYVTDLDIDFPGKPPIPKGPFAKNPVNNNPLDPLEVTNPSNADQFGMNNSSQESETYEYSQLVGLRYFLIPYKEKTMQKERRSDLTAVALNFRGENWIDWAGFVDMGLLFSLGYPRHYREILGFEPRGGLLFWGYFLISTSSSISKKSQFNYGFGPFLKFQQLYIESKTTNNLPKFYEATDVKGGGTALFGISYRWRRLSFRFDWQYFWEVTQYSTLSGGIELALD